MVIAHVGGRYADIHLAHDGRLERAVEVHSTWGTFEWLLHDAFAQGYRVGVVCHSDDHKGRPGATRPGASTFGALGGLTCYFMPELTRDALFEALRRRRHYGTTGTRLFMDLRATFPEPVMGFSDDPQLGPAQQHRVREATMGDIVRPGSVPMQLGVEIIGTAPIERLDILHGTQLVQTVRPYAAADLGRRVRVLWQGAEYRGRGRETHWQGRLTLTGNRISALRRGEFSQPRAAGARDEPRDRARLDLRDHRQPCRCRPLAGWSASTGFWTWRRTSFRAACTSPRSPTVPLPSKVAASIAELSVYRLPEADWSSRVACRTYSWSEPAPRTSRSMSASPRRTATRPGRARST